MTAPTPRANRLQQETSPYLQQHAFNPVDWYPWGSEALERARAEEKPIFLSIGYSACHWCHVMEHESFENAEIAAVMNEHFVNIKVDREERPDLDQIYMNAVLALTGRGGWPMSVFLTPELKPFFGGTYWPPNARMGMPGFRDILLRVHEVWTTQRDDLMQSAERLAEAVRQMGRAESEAAELSVDVLRNAERSLIRATDRTHGGFGAAPKFPHAMDLRVLLRCAKRFGNSDALATAELTLDKMAAGGIYDHLGGGFHRYATDSKWLVPHFEKMLYDNALLVPAYLEAWQLTGKPRCADVVRETLDYVLREMTQPEGGFYSTQDADSEGEEGKFFVWHRHEVDEVLGEDAEVFRRVYDVTEEGNWEGKSILQRVLDGRQAAAMFSKSEDEIDEMLARCKQKLFERRRERVAPARDEKVLTSWNGLMIAAMARAGFVLDEERYLDAARSAADFVLGQMRDADGRLVHCWKDGRARFSACLDDYSGFIDGLTELFLATGEVRYLEEAVGLADDMLARFRDEESTGLFFTAEDHEALIARNLDVQDGATPAGNSLAATALVKLGRLASRSDLEDASFDILKLLSGQMSRTPLAAGQGLIALDHFLGPAWEAVFFAGEDRSASEAVVEAFRKRFLPNVLLVEATKENAGASLLKAHVEGRGAVENAPTLYLCERGRCEQPLTGDDAICERIKAL